MLTYNLACLLVCVASGYAMYLLARSLSPEHLEPEFVASSP